MSDTEKKLQEPPKDNPPRKKLTAREIILRMSKLLTKDEAEELATTFYAERAKRRGEAL
ncbi:MAG: hypothetical protein IKE46_00900 [Selenomonadaceae bacterium]|nr:hypothetical protein [Selenomonadaceae bacterium]